MRIPLNYGAEKIGVAPLFTCNNEDVQFVGIEKLKPNIFCRRQV